MLGMRGEGLRGGGHHGDPQEWVARFGLQRGDEPLGGATAFRGANGKESDRKPN